MQQQFNLIVSDGEIDLLYAAMKRFAEHVDPQSSYRREIQPMQERLLVARSQVRSHSEVAALTQNEVFQTT